MSEVKMLIGKRTTGNSEVVRIPGRFKQFMASLNGAATENTAAVAIFALPDSEADPAKGVLVATLELTGSETGAISPIVECLAANYIAVVAAIDGGEVWLTGVNE